MLAVLLAAAPTTGPRPYTIEDQVRMRRVSGAAVSPDGERIAFVLRSTDMDANKGRTDVWMVRLDGSGLRQLTSHPANDSDPVWAPDGKSLYFLSTRTGSSQVHRLPVDGGGEAQAVTSLPLDVGAFTLSRDGKTLAVALEVYPDCATLECTVKRNEEAAARKSTGQLYDSLFVRHWDTWKDGHRSHLFVLPVEGGTPRDVMKGMAADAPSKPFGDATEFTFTPDGKGLVFTARDEGRQEAWSTNLDLFLAPVDGTKAPVRLTPDRKGTDTGPVFSPDGKWLAYRSMERPGYEADRQRVVLRSWPDGKERVLTPDWDRSADSLAWSADGKTLYTVAQNVGQHSLFALDAQSGKARTVVEQGSVGDVGVAAGGQLVYSLNTLKTPADLFAVKADGTGARQLTRVNQDALAKLQFGDFEQFSFPGWNGEKVHGYLVKPVGFDPKKKYPVAYLIHGGPQGSYGNNFHYRWNPQVYTGHGYAVVMVDFHGSTGYGQAFTDAIRNDWGGKPLEDLQKGLAFALQKYPFLDEGRMCALGASYGGYMINWIAGQWPDRFRCLVNHDGNLDEKMAYYDTEELWFPEWEHGGTPWENAAGYTKQNPVDHVAKWKTPMLVIHGGRDYRVVDTQGLSTFTVLQRRGIPSKLLYFPDENHWVLKPYNSVLWHGTVLDWLDTWTSAKGRRGDKGAAHH
ncbi:MAG: S9 family peptidase [Myxococcaceae bacterium]|nr:S9 family peptidase [Myxococcaceae bacterium]